MPTKLKPTCPWVCLVPCSLGIAADRCGTPHYPKTMAGISLKNEHQLTVHQNHALIITEKELHSPLECPGLAFTLRQKDRRCPKIVSHIPISENWCCSSCRWQSRLTEDPFPLINIYFVWFLSPSLRKKIDCALRTAVVMTERCSFSNYFPGEPPVSSHVILGRCTR